MTTTTPASGSAFAVPGLTIDRELGKGAQSVVFAARHGTTDVALKVIRDVTDAAARKRFFKEAGLLASLDHPALVRVHAVGVDAGMPWLALDAIPGGTLSARLARGPLPVADAADLALTLCGALSELHARGLVHRDVKSENILLTADGRPVLIDLGLAVRASAEDSGQVGTFAYSAPEQTGMLARPVDGRSDLYSLGVVLFEMLAGRLPFIASDPSELVRLHAVELAPDVRKFRPEVGERLAALTASLLAKDPDDRPQSAAEVARALRPGLAAPESRRHSVRQALLEGLHDAYATATLTGGGVVQVKGAPGMGKTCLAETFLAELEAEGRLVLRCGVTKGALALGPLRQALEALAQTAQKLPSERRAALMAQVRAAAGPASPLLVSFAPALATFFTEVTPEAVGADLRDRLLEAIAQFLRTLSREAHGACLWVDDAHALDESSRDVMARLSSNFAQAPLLVLATTAHEAESPPWQWGESGFRRGLQLEPLSEQEMNRLCQLELGKRRTLAPDIVATLTHRSQGNPQQALSYLQAVVDEGVLRPVWGKWELDREALERMQLPGSFSELLSAQIAQLGDDSRRLLSVASLENTRFAWEPVLNASGLEHKQALRALEEATRARLVEPDGPRHFAFVHEQVRAALAQVVPEGERRLLHVRLAQGVAATEHDHPDSIFSVARHYEAAGPEAPPALAFAAALNAGVRAAAGFSFQDAHGFLAQARATQHAFDRPAALTLNATSGRVAIALGQIELGVEFLKQALADTVDALDRAELLHAMAHAHFTNLATSAAWDCLTQGFAALGRNLNAWVMEYLRVGWVSTVLLFARLFGLSLTTQNAHWQRRHRLLAKLSEVAAIVAYFRLRPLRTMNLNILGLYSAMRVGPSVELINCLANAAAGFGDVRLGRVSLGLVEEGERIAKDLRTPVTDGTVTVYWAYALHFSGGSARSAVDGEQHMGRALVESDQWLDHLELGLATGDLAWNLWMRGYLSESTTWLNRLAERSARTSSPLLVQSAAGLIHMGIDLMSGKPEEAKARLESARAQLSGNAEQVYRRAFLMQFEVMVQSQTGGTSADLDRLEAQWRALKSPVELTVLHPRGYFVQLAYARLAQLEKDPSPENEAAARRAMGQLRRMGAIPTLECHRRVLVGTLSRLRGQPSALSQLESASRLAQEVDCPWVIGEAALQLALWWRAQGHEKAARREASVAHHLARKHGWTARARELEASFAVDDAHVRHDTRAPQETVMATSATTTADGIQLQRRFRALTDLSLASARLVEPDAVAAVALRQAVRTLGAERGAIFLRGDDGRVKFQLGEMGDGTVLNEFTGYSSTAVDRVAHERVPLILSGTDKGDLLGSESAVAHGLRSIIVAPIAMQEELIGVLYLDSRVAKGVFKSADVDMLGMLGTPIAAAIATARSAMNEALQRQQAKDLELTAAVQNLFLPRQRLARSGAVTVCGCYRPASLCGGDWWWYDESPEGLTVFVGDVTGHGAPSAMVTASTASFFRARKQQSRQSMEDFLADLNTDLLQLSQGEYRFVLSALVIAGDGRSLRWLNAASPPLFLMDAAGKVTALNAVSAPLGANAELQVSTVERALQPGDRILAYTDGLNELALPDGRQLGTKRLAKIFAATRAMGAEAAVDYLSAQLDVERGSVAPPDDITYAIIDV